MGTLDGRTGIITGAGRGLGREHALLMAAEGARIVINDLGSAADEVVDEITALGGEAIASHHDITDWVQGRELVQTAVDRFGGLDYLVNNAGIVRDRVLVKLDEDDWDAIMSVHLKGHFVPTKWAAAYWRDQHKAGNPVSGSLIHTASTSGLLGNIGQSNYAAAKGGIASFSLVCSMELQRYGVRSNCIVPAARTRLTENAVGVGDIVKAPEDPDAFDQWHPGNVSPVVAYLATADCPLTASTIFVRGGDVTVMEPWKMGETLERPHRWTVDELAKELPSVAPTAPPKR